MLRMILTVRRNLNIKYQVSSVIRGSTTPSAKEGFVEPWAIYLPWR